jgi:ATP-dependent Clp protease, protease subunit
MKRTNDSNNLIEEIHDYCIDISTRQIYLHDSTKEECEDGIDFRVATRFMKNLALLEKTTDDIIIHQYSKGGQFDAGVLIYDAICASNCPITIVCHGVVMSIATVILQSADIRVSMPNCIFMFHEGSEGADGTHKQAQSWSKMCKRQRDWMMNIYAEKCLNSEKFQGLPISKVKQKLVYNFEKNEDWYLTAEEALSYGFIDKIIEPHGLVELAKRN